MVPLRFRYEEQLGTTLFIAAPYRGVSHWRESGEAKRETGLKSTTENNELTTRRNKGLTLYILFANAKGLRPLNAGTRTLLANDAAIDARLGEYKCLDKYTTSRSARRKRRLFTQLTTYLLPYGTLWPFTAVLVRSCKSRCLCVYIIYVYIMV